MMGALSNQSVAGEIEKCKSNQSGSARSGCFGASLCRYKAAMAPQVNRQAAPGQRQASAADHPHPERRRPKGCEPRPFYFAWGCFRNFCL